MINYNDMLQYYIKGKEMTVHKSSIDQTAQDTSRKLNNQANDPNYQLQPLSINVVPAVISKHMAADPAYKIESDKLDLALSNLKTGYDKAKANITVNNPTRVIEFQETAVADYQAALKAPINAIDRKLTNDLQVAESQLFTSKGKQLTPVDLALMPQTLDKLQSPHGISKALKSKQMGLMALELYRGGYYDITAKNLHRLNEVHTPETVEIIKKINSYRGMFESAASKLINATDQNKGTYEKLQKILRGKK